MLCVRANAFQHAAKALAFYRAEMYLDEAQGAALRQIASAPARPTLYAYARADTAAPSLLHFDGGDQILNPDSQALQTEDGTISYFQRERNDLAQFVALVPALKAGLTQYVLVDRAIAPPASIDSNDANSLQNDRWHLQVDPHTGGLSSLRETRTHREWIQPNSDHAFGQLVHETVVHPAGRDAVGNPARLIALGVAGERLKAQALDVPLFEHGTPQVTGAMLRSHGPIFDELRQAGFAPRIGQVAISWRLYHHTSVVELVLDWEKAWCDLPEAAYVVFPFAAAHGAVQLETAGGMFTPGSHARGDNCRAPAPLTTPCSVQPTSARMITRSCCGCRSMHRWC